MATIKELKKIDNIRQDILSELKWKPCSEDEIGFGMRSHVYEMTRQGWCDWTIINGDLWFWLTDAGFRRLGYEPPEYYGDPTCEDCNGEGRIDGWEAGDEPEMCDNCGGTGVDRCEVTDLFALDGE